MSCSEDEYEEEEERSLMGAVSDGLLKTVDDGCFGNLPQEQNKTAETSERCFLVPFRLSSVYWI